jgi:hypothetical protein
VVIVYRCFGTVLSVPSFKGQESEKKRELLTLEDGTNKLSRKIRILLPHDAA